MTKKVKFKNIEIGQRFTFCFDKQNELWEKIEPNKEQREGGNIRSLLTGKTDFAFSRDEVYLQDDKPVWYQLSFEQLSETPGATRPDVDIKRLETI